MSLPTIPAAAAPQRPRTCFFCPPAASRRRTSATLKATPTASRTRPEFAERRTFPRGKTQDPFRLGRVAQTREPSVPPGQAVLRVVRRRGRRLAYREAGSDRPRCTSDDDWYLRCIVGKSGQIGETARTSGSDRNPTRSVCRFCC